MTFTHLNGCYDSIRAEDDSMDLEAEFYNIPDQRIIDMLEEVHFDSE